MPKRATITARQARAIQSLLTARTVDDAAGQAGVSKRTLMRWLSDSAFAGALRAAQDEMIGATVRRLAGGASDALDALRAAITADGEEAPPINVRIRAADLWLSHMHTLRTAHDLDSRLQQLEAAMIAVQEGQGRGKR